MEGQIEKLQNWLNELQTLKSESQIVYNNLNIIKKENENLLAQIFQLKSVISSKDELIEVLQNQKTALLSDNTELLCKVDELNIQVQSFEQMDNSKLEETLILNAELTTTNTELIQEIETLQNVIVVLKTDQQDFENTKNEWQNTTFENNNLKFALDEKNNQIEEQNETLKALDISLEEKLNTIGLLEKSIENLGTQLSQQILKGEVATALQNQNTLLQAEIEILKNQNENILELTTTVDELTLKNLQLVAVTNDLVRDKMEAQWEIAQFKTKEQELSNADNLVRETIQDLMNQNKSSQEEKEAFTEQIYKLELQNTEFVNTLNILNLNNSKLTEDLIAKERQSLSVVNDIERLNTLLKDGHSEVLIWEDKALNAIKEKENLEQELIALKQQFAELEDTIINNKQAQSNLANHRNNLFSQNEIVEKDYESEMALQLESLQLAENHDNLVQNRDIQAEKHKHLQTMNNSVKLAKNTTSDIEDTNVLKDRINQLVGEIDKCIDLLSNS